MRTDAAKKAALKIAGKETHEPFSTGRRTLSVLQPAATDKENLVGHSRLSKKVKLSAETIKEVTFSDKGIQTDAVITAEDLSSDYPGYNYWKKLAEKREEDLNESYKENEKLKADIEALQEENRVCKEMLNESITLVDILKEELVEKNTDEEADEKETEETENND